MQMKMSETMLLTVETPMGKQAIWQILRKIPGYKKTEICPETKETNAIINIEGRDLMAIFTNNTIISPSELIPAITIALAKNQIGCKLEKHNQIIPEAESETRLETIIDTIAIAADTYPDSPAA